MLRYDRRSAVGLSILYAIVGSCAALRAQDAPNALNPEHDCKTLLARVREYSNAESLMWAIDSRIQLAVKLNRSCPGLMDREIANSISLIREVPSPAGRSKLARAILPLLVKQPLGVAQSLIAALPEGERDGAYFRLIEEQQGPPPGLLQIAGNCTGAASFCPRTINLAIYLARKSDKSVAIALVSLLISSLPNRELSVAEIEHVFVTCSLAMSMGEPKVVQELLLALRGMLPRPDNGGRTANPDEAEGKLQLSADAVRRALDEMHVKVSDYERRQDIDLRSISAAFEALRRAAFMPAGGRPPAKNVHEGRFGQDLEPYRIHYKFSPDPPAAALREGDARGDVELSHQIVADEFRSLSAEQKRQGIAMILNSEGNATRTILRYHALKLALRWSCIIRDSALAYTSANRLASLLNTYFRNPENLECATCDTVYLDGMETIIGELKSAELLDPQREGLQPSVMARILLNLPTGVTATADDRRPIPQ